VTVLTLGAGAPLIGAAGAWLGVSTTVITAGLLTAAAICAFYGLNFGIYGATGTNVAQNLMGDTVWYDIWNILGIAAIVICAAFVIACVAYIAWAALFAPKKAEQIQQANKHNREVEKANVGELMTQSKTKSKKRILILLTIFLLIAIVGVVAWLLLRTPAYINFGDQRIPTDSTDVQLELSSGDNINALRHLRDLEHLAILPGEEPLTERESTRLIDTISGLTNLRELDLSFIPITDISPLSSLVNLESLTLNDNGLADLTGVEGMVNLQNLIAIYNEITDLSSLSSNISLERLSLSFNADLSDLSPLRSLINLQDLSLQGTNISDLSPLSSLVNLRLLDIENTAVTSLAPLSELKYITHIYANYNDITCLEPLRGMPILSELWIFNNNVTDLEPLSELFTLRKLEFGGNSVTDLSPLEHLYETVINPMSGE